MSERAPFEPFEVELGAARAGLRPAAFVDRDGTLTVESDWVRRGQDLELVPGAGEALAELARAGFVVVVITNQSAIARGIIDEIELAGIHAHLAELLAREHGAFEALYYCPHHPTEGIGAWKRECECRKPRPGLLLRAARELGLDLSRSVTIGDAARDLEAGWAAGTRAALVRTGKGRAELEQLSARGVRPDFVADDVLRAALWAARWAAELAR